MSTLDRSFDVPVKTWLPFETYRTLNQLATQRGTTVAVLVAVAAKQAVGPKPLPPARAAGRRQWRTLNDPVLFARFCELVKTDMTMKQVADELGVSIGTVYNHLNRARNTP